MNKFIIPVCIYFFTLSCRAQTSSLPVIDDKLFSDYWYTGKAEISTYELTQSRYDSSHDGSVTLIFVTEDISKSKHVKLDNPKRNAKDAIKVLKLNTMKEFVTGIYKYSMMSSIFSPVDYEEMPHALKLTCSSQDWCGQSYMQANWKGNRYEVNQFSYFESEGDRQYSLMNPWLEDQIWTTIRLAPHTLQAGEIRMIPSAFYLRLSHKQNKVYKAIASLSKQAQENIYKIEYPELGRSIEITFRNQFPFVITGWKETYGDNEITTARLSVTQMSDYWNLHFPRHENLRKELNLKD